MNKITPNLLVWQFDGYPAAHKSRSNLLVHAVAVPFFQAGILAVVLAAVLSFWLAPLGVALMLASLVAQGRGHKSETTAPAPFLGPLDFVARLFAEQCITFPRFVLSGGFARAWRATH